VLWATTARFVPYPQAAVHAFCHALPNTWHQMGVTLSAAASLGWWARVTGQSEAALLAEMEWPRAPAPALFLPYLSGERTPHNDGAIRGAFAGLAHEADRGALTQAVLEGVAFSLRDCLDAITASGTAITEADVIGGGARSRAWVVIIAAALGITLRLPAEGEYDAAFGAARLARLAATGEAPEAICAPPTRAETIAPDPALAGAYAERLARYRALYPALSGALS
jgi:xylulokinase